MLKEFRDFLLRGNLIELAVALVLGLAFAALVASFVDDLIMPIIAMIVGKPDFSDLTFTHQRRRIPLRRLHHRPDHVHLDRSGDLLLRRQAARRDSGEDAEAGRGRDHRRGAAPPGASGGDPRERALERRRARRSSPAGRSRTFSSGAEDAGYERLARGRVVPDRQRLPRPAEDDLLVGDEARQPNGVDLRARAHACRRRLGRPRRRVALRLGSAARRSRRAGTPWPPLRRTASSARRRGRSWERGSTARRLPAQQRRSRRGRTPTSR